MPSLSVRARIVALALIPVVGFIANGLHYVVSEREVSSAFAAVAAFEHLDGFEP